METQNTTQSKPPAPDTETTQAQPEVVRAQPAEPETNNGAAVPAVVPPRTREVRVVSSNIDVLDTARFEHMQRIATVMANMTLIPDALCMQKVGDKEELLPFENIVANCFLVVNQAARWEADPFAVAQCVSVVKGKIVYEGKLIAAMLDAQLGYKLEYDITGEGEAMQVIVSAAENGESVKDSKGRPKIIVGTVRDWKTTRSGSPWSAPGGFVRMLRYRGAREWARVHAPGIMLGIIADDEAEDFDDQRRARNARVVGDSRAVVSDGPPEPDAVASGGAQTAPQTAATGATSDPPPPEEEAIPGFLRREEEMSEDDATWLNDVKGAFSSCEDMMEFFNKQRDVMMPQKGKVSSKAWLAAQATAEDTFKRLQKEP